jgi:hypothetical protein
MGIKYTNFSRTPPSLLKKKQLEAETHHHKSYQKIFGGSE